MNKQFKQSEFNGLMVIYLLEMARNKDQLLSEGKITGDVYEILRYLSLRNFVINETSIKSHDPVVKSNYKRVVSELKLDADVRLII